MMQHLKNQKGFSLLDATLATMIMALGLMGGLLLMQNATRASVHVDYYVIGTELAHQKIESIIADKANRTDKYDYIEEANYADEDLSYLDQDDVFTRSVSIEEVDPIDMTTPLEGSGFKKVEVTVAWESLAYAKSTTITLPLFNREISLVTNKNKSIKLGTIISKY